MKAFTIYISCFLLLSLTIFAQEEESAKSEQPHLIKLSGYIYSEHDQSPIPYAHVLNQNKRSGTVGRVDGFFSTIVKPGDTLSVSAIGYKRTRFDIPEIEEESYYLLVFMPVDTFTLSEAIIYPFDKNTFKHHFLSLDRPTGSDSIILKIEDFSDFIAPPPLTDDGKPKGTGVVIAGAVSKPLAAIQEFVRTRKRKPKIAKTLPDWE